MNEKQIGTFIKEKRIEKNSTQQELADKLFVTNKAISKWEHGKCMPSIDLLKPLCQELDIELNELLEGKKIENQKDSYEKLLLKELKTKQKRIYRVIFGLVMCLTLCFLEVLLYITHTSDTVAYLVFLLFIIVLLCFDIYEWLMYKKK